MFENQHYDHGNNLTLLRNNYNKNEFKILKKDTGSVSYENQFNVPDGFFY